MRNQRRRFEFEEQLVAVNNEFEIPPGRNASQDAPRQFAYVRKVRRRIARSRLHQKREARGA
jgi:hypothetical protein